MVKTISIPEDLHKELMRIKLDSNNKNIAEILKQMLIAYREKKLLEHSKKFKGILKKEGVTFEEFLKRAEKIREEVANELFPK
jgi:predicted CopG family antitoxin